MGLNKVKGNMYSFLNDYPKKGSNRGYTWNTCKGQCPHICEYCFMRRFGKQPDLHFDEKELKTDLGEGNFIFVGSSCDMFSDKIPGRWILQTLARCRKFNNKYLFQTKNPGEILFWWLHKLPTNSIIGTTIETNRQYPQMGITLSPTLRSENIQQISNNFYKTMVTIEPIMDFDLDELVSLIKDCNPEWVNIGADSQNSKLPEPPAEKIEQLIIQLKKFTEVKVKKNLRRILYA